MNHRFFTLDVFTTTRFQGNPLAVITDGDGLSNDQMLAIAREMNLSETVFVQKPTDDRALACLRIFTTGRTSCNRNVVSSGGTWRRARARRRSAHFTADWRRRSSRGNSF